MGIRIIFITFLFLLTACGGGTISSSKDLQNKNNTIQTQLAVAQEALLGYWTPKNSTNDEFEFFPTTTEGPGIPLLKTGRIYNQGSMTALFYWDLQSDGTINVSVVDAGCQSRPLNNCPVNNNISISLAGDTVKNAKWSFIYRNAGNSILKTNNEDYVHKDVNVNDFNTGEFYLTKTRNFGTPLLGSYINNKLLIRLDGLASPINISSVTSNAPLASVKLSSDGVVNSTREFYVEGVGYKTIPIKQWYDNALLLASTDNHYVLTYDLRSEIVVPADIDSNAIRLENFTKTVKETQVLELIKDFSKGPTVGSSEEYYSYVPIDFIKNGDIDNNQINFDSMDTGSIGHGDLFNAKRVLKQKFHWVQLDDSQILLSVENFGEIAIKFISTVPGGYKVLYKWRDSTFGDRYLIHDFLRDTYPVINSSDFPGRFKFISSDQWSEQEITFHQDNTISSNPDLVGGFWFRDSNGDVISYECSTTLGVSIKNYVQCLSSFGDLSNVSFAHVRHLHILNKTGNNYKIKYDAIYYGDRYFITGDNYFIVSWTYNWTRVGNESN